MCLTPLLLPCPAARHVHKLSTMERAIGGAHLFPSQSPALSLANALKRQRRQGLLQARHASWEALQANPAELLEEAVGGGGRSWGADPCRRRPGIPGR
jgi:hypothetical protein